MSANMNIIEIWRGRSERGGNYNIWKKNIHQDDLSKGRLIGSRDARETHRVESREEADRRGRIQWKREELLHAQWGLDGRHGGAHQGGHEAILTCVTCRRESEKTTCWTADGSRDASASQKPSRSRPSVCLFGLCHKVSFALRNIIFVSLC